MTQTMETFDANEFFREATLRICGSLEIEKSLWHCLLYIRNFIPASQMSLHIYDHRLGIVETIAHATGKGYKALSVKVALPAESRKQIDSQRSLRIRRVSRIIDDPVSAPLAKHLEAFELAGIKMDLSLEGKFVGILSVQSEPGEQFTSKHENILSILNEPFAVALTNSLRYRELKELKNFLTEDNKFLQKELRRLTGEEILGADKGLKDVMEMVRRVAPLECPVLLLGETGVGKELLANKIHMLSERNEAPFIKVNCGAIPQSLIDSELFGHEKGAFTGAISQKRGRFERAHGGTIFLDEIGELSLDAQVKLLRVLQEKEIERVGGGTTLNVNIRVVAATHRDLDSMMEEGRFREDLYFRLNVFPISIPPLRDRTEDLPAMVQYFIQRKSREMKIEAPRLEPVAIDRLIGYHWPGNIRELGNVIERELILSKGDTLAFANLTFNSNDSSSPPVLSESEALGLDSAMAEHIRKVLKQAGGKVEGKGGAAELLGINPRTLRHRMKRLNVPFGKAAKDGGRG